MMHTGEITLYPALDVKLKYSLDAVIQMELYGTKTK